MRPQNPSMSPSPSPSNVVDNVEVNVIKPALNIDLPGKPPIVGRQLHRRPTASEASQAQAARRDQAGFPTRARARARARARSDAAGHGRGRGLRALRATGLGPEFPDSRPRSLGRAPASP